MVRQHRRAEGGDRSGQSGELMYSMDLLFD